MRATACRLRNPLRFPALLALAVFLAPHSADAQGFPFSQRGTVSQMVAFTEISAAYGRPVARGRTLFGVLVPWDSVWHPGADSATRLTFSHDVLLEGHALRAGEYSLWLIPRETGTWTVILSRAARVFHQPYPGAAHDALRLEVAPDSASHMETMAIYFPLVLRDDAVLQLHWGRTVLPLRIKAPFRPGAASGGSLASGRREPPSGRAAPPSRSQLSGLER